MSSNPLHAAHDGAGAASNTLRKDSTRYQSSVPTTKSKLVKNRIVSSENEASSSSWQPLQPGSSPSTFNARNRLKKYSGNGSHPSVESYQADSDITPKLPPNQPSTSNPPMSPRNLNSVTSMTPASASTASTAQPSSSRPVPLRTQSYSKRHASFDTPREVPLPAVPPGQEGLPTFDDSEQERGKSWQQQQQPQSRHASGTQRRLTIDPGPASSIQLPPISVPADTVTQSSNEEYPSSSFSQPPQFPRNNSAPTPPRTPGAERVDLRLWNEPLPELDDRSESNSPGNASSSDDTPSLHSLASQDPPSLGGNTPGKGSDSIGGRKGIHMNSSDSRLSTTSLPLPHAYGAERVSRLPSTSRHSGTSSIADKALNTPPVIQEGPVVQNLPSTSHTVSEPSSAMGYRSSYPIAPVAGNMPLSTDQPSPLSQNPTPSTAFRFSASSLSRQFLPEDEDDRDAIKRGRMPKLPEIEAPKAVLHPFLATPTSKTAHTVEAVVEKSNVESPRDSRNSINSPSASVTDRTSTASGSSGVSSEIMSIIRPASESIRGSWVGDPPISRLRNPRPSTSGAEHTAVATSFPPSSTGQASEPLAETNGMQNAPSGPVMTVETTPSSYVLQASLPGYQRDEITISTRKKRILHVVADGFVSGGTHFERRVSFGYDADMMRVRAEFNGSMLKITVPRRPTPQSFAASLNTSTSASGSSPFSTSSNSMFWRGRSNII